jgi:hypothetical protein
VPHTHWGDGKRRLASTWVWTQVTHGDHIYAPAVRPDPQAHDPAVTTSTPAGATSNAPQPGGHYRDLRQRLDPLIEQLANEVDGMVRTAHRSVRLILINGPSHPDAWHG